MCTVRVSLKFPLQSMHEYAEQMLPIYPQCLEECGQVPASETPGLEPSSLSTSDFIPAVRVAAVRKLYHFAWSPAATHYVYFIRVACRCNNVRDVYGPVWFGPPELVEM